MSGSTRTGSILTTEGGDRPTDRPLKSPRVLSLLSKHPTRDPGGCRDDLTIAVSSGNNKTDHWESDLGERSPGNIGHIHWLDMHGWKNRYLPSQTPWKLPHQPNFAEVFRVEDSDESCRVVGEIETPNGHLAPIRSEARICLLPSKGFCTRQWLFEAVNEWRCAPAGTLMSHGGKRTWGGSNSILRPQEHGRARRRPRRPCRPILRMPLGRLPQCAASCLQPQLSLTHAELWICAKWLGSDGQSSIAHHI